MTAASENVYRNDDGDLCTISDPNARVLVYAVGNEMTDADAKALADAENEGLAAKEEASKQAAPAENKQGARPANKNTK